MKTLAELIKRDIAKYHLINHCVNTSVSSIAAVTCDGWVFTFKDDSELTVNRSGDIIEG